MSKRVIAVFTGNRSEYGIQYPILKTIAKHPDLDYRLIVSGTHLDPQFGRTLSEIEQDGFTVHAESKLDVADDSLFGTAEAIGSGVIAISRLLRKMQPDIALVYGDRFESFAASIASTQMRIPTAHIEGGDLTEGGALDDSVRHAMTKLSHIHFPTNQESADRIARMGEETWRIHNVGYLTLDLIVTGQYAKPEELKAKYGIRLDRPILLFTQHSVSMQFDQAMAQLTPSLNALEKMATKGVQVIMTYANNDAGGKSIVELLECFRDRKLENVQVHKSLGRHDYHGFLHLCGKVTGGACIGNSSSGLKETPAFSCPAINIGTRQSGRLAAKNVIPVSYEETAILQAIEKCLYDKDFLNLCRTCDNPYGAGNASEKMAAVLAQAELNERMLIKKTTI